MKTVKDLLKGKGYDIWAVAPDDSVHDALKLMADKNVGAVLVMDSDRLVGILSERDYARKVIFKGKLPEDTPVREIMTEKVLWVRPDQTVEECMALMTDKRVRHLPVIEDDELIGVISIGDVVKSIISHQEFMIEQLEHYITGGYFRP
jgi:CBS domain-containing protein